MAGINQPVEDAERDEIFGKLKANADNNKCFDCDKKNPKWSSVYLGIYLCLDCAGKHREYGPQISFARSVNLDSWNRRYITFMELGGNTKALEAFRKNGLKTPYDYKNPAIQKYKAELTKKVDAALGSSTNKAQEEAKPVTVKAEEPKTNLISNEPASGSSNVFGEEKKTEDDPCANNVIIKKDEVKTKGFSVEFNKNKPAFGSGNKGRLAAKKIDNVDLDSLTLNEDGSAIKSNHNDMMPTSAGLKMSMNSVDSTNEVKEVFTKGSSPYLKEADQQSFDKYKNAKAISSDSFKNETSSADNSNYRQFSGATSISSAQFYGEKETPNQGIDYYDAAEKVKDFVNVWGTKLKEKSEGFMSKIKSEWQQ